MRARRAQRGGEPLSQEGDGRGSDRDHPGEGTGSPEPDPSLRPRGTRSALAIMVLVAITGGALFGAVQISRATAESASTLHATDQAIRAATIVRAQLALASLGSEQQKETSINEAEASLEALGESLARLEERGGYPETVESGRRFAETAGGILAGDPAVGEEELDASFTDAIAALDMLRVRLASQIELIESRYLIVGILLGLATAGLAPFLVMLWVRSTARRRLELEEMSLRLEQERRIRDARSDLLRTVVHEFRTPLTGITGLAALLEDPDVRLSSEAGEMVEMIRREGEDLAHLTDDILTSERLETSQLEIRAEGVEVAEAVEQVVAMFERRGVAIEVQCSSGLVVADPLRLRQVIRNLVSNAVKYGGPSLGVVGQLEQGGYLLSVVDDGPGLPESVESRLFRPFPHAGSDGVSPLSVGLGLSIAHRLVEAMGGSLEYRRVDGLTMFELSLPLVDVEAEIGERLGSVEAVG